jgi:L-lactate utilization protein LutC
MEEFAEKNLEKKIEKTMTALKKNNMAVYYVKTKEEVKPLVESLMKEGESVTHGGSVTLKECGLVELLKSGKYNYIDRSTAKTREETEEIYRKAFFADNYIFSANAITETGLLYNVDGNSNRIAAVAYGPKSVICIAGYNKIVRTLDDAVARVKTTAAPPNAIRLSCETPCANSGECISKDFDSSSIGLGCASEGRICCNYLVSAQQRHKDRIKVIIVGEVLGY